MDEFDKIIAAAVDGGQARLRSFGEGSYCRNIPNQVQASAVADGNWIVIRRFEYVALEVGKAVCVGGVSQHGLHASGLNPFRQAASIPDGSIELHEFGLILDEVERLHVSFENLGQAMKGRLVDGVPRTETVRSGAEYLLPDICRGRKEYEFRW